MKVTNNNMALTSKVKKQNSTPAFTSEVKHEMKCCPNTKNAGQKLNKIG